MPNQYFHNQENESLHISFSQYNHLLEPWECPPSVIKAQCNQESEGILWLGRKVMKRSYEYLEDNIKFKVGVKCLKEVESATVVYVGRGEETLLGVVHTLPNNKVPIQTK